MLLKGKWHGLQMCNGRRLRLLVFFFSSLSLFLSPSCNRSSGRLLHMDCENMEMLEKRVSAGDLLHSRRIKMINYTSVRGEIEKKKLL